ncbi:MAG: hypothetical protein WKF84_20160 [Pyrinomonadaceae bacterium]
MLILGLCLALQQSWAYGELSRSWFKSLALVGLPIVVVGVCRLSAVLFETSITG